VVEWKVKIEEEGRGRRGEEREGKGKKISRD
jgi:hypothetical protein